MLLPALRPVLGYVLRQAGHDELLPLTGFLMAIGGGALFTLVGLKADFGALLFGILLSNQSKSEELAKALMSFKDVFLIGFFLSIGFTALPSWDMLIRDGRLRSDLRGSLTIAGTDLALYHHEQHMGKVEFQIWVDYLTAAPSKVAAFDGVPVIWVYRRPGPGAPR